MNYISQLIEDEVRFVCSIVPYQDTINYFTKNAKEFSKIRPGFRAKAISKSDANKLLIAHISKPFISDFVDKHINNWLSQIQKFYNERLGSGESKEIALIHTLPFSFFAENVKLYFKLIGEELSEENIALMSEAVKSIKESTDEQNRLAETLKIKDSEIRNLQAEIYRGKSELSKNKTKLKNSVIEIDDLKSRTSQIENLQVAILKDKQKINSLQNENTDYVRTIVELKTAVAEAESDSRHLKERIREELEKQQITNASEQLSARNLKRPRDMDEFKEYLGYNLEDCGVPPGAVYYPLLTEHLGRILFEGVPIIVNHSTGVNIAKCVANTIIGQSTYKTLTFNKSTSLEDINQFLSSVNRIVCLDNFIGNFNETELIPIFENHRNIVIFLTVAYDKTLRYISKEFLRYGHYFNGNRIPALSNNAVLKEDPSTIEENNYEPQWADTKNRFSIILREVLQELGYPQSLIEQKCARINDEQALCQMLAFDVLPYCMDVLQLNPYNTSERLLKYAGDVGRSPYKQLFREWFA